MKDKIGITTMRRGSAADRAPYAQAALNGSTVMGNVQHTRGGLWSAGRDRDVRPGIYIFSFSSFSFIPQKRRENSRKSDIKRAKNGNKEGDCCEVLSPQRVILGDFPAYINQIKVKKGVYHKRAGEGLGVLGRKTRI